MNQEHNQIITAPASEPGVVRKVFPWLVAGALAVSLGANYVQHNQTNLLGKDLAAMRQEMANVKSSLSNQEANVRKSMESVEDRLKAATEDVSSQVDKAKKAARAQTSVLEAKIQKQQAEVDKKISGELAQLKESTQNQNQQLSSINTEVGSVKTDVGQVRTEVQAAKSELERTIQDLRRVRGDLGEMSGLIATNSKELAALRELGERNYFEFALSKNQGVQRVGDVQIALKKVDVKKNRYTMEIVSGDLRIEKKDKTANEPVQFYMASKSRQAYEVVVNEVQKDRIVGYLATPKTQVSRN